jgi:hypothetical protein
MLSFMRMPAGVARRLGDARGPAAAARRGTVLPRCAPLPSRGDPPGRDAHASTPRGQAGRRLLPLVAPAPDRRVVGEAKAHRTRAEPPGARRWWGEFWQTRTGHAPPGRSLAATLVP